MKKKYYDGTEHKKVKSRYKLIIGARENGKSYFWKKDVIKTCLEKKWFFCYLRRTKDETKPIAVEEYFSDCDIEKLTKKKYSKVIVYRSELFLSSESSDDKLKIGRVCTLAEWERYKSQAFNNYFIILFEEFCIDPIVKKSYLNDEFIAFQNMVSTVLRGREESYVVMIGNTLTRLCPYFREFGLKNVPFQEEGTIELYDYTSENTKVSISVEMTRALEQLNTFYVGRAEKITSSGWSITDECLRLPCPYTEYDKLYELIIRHELLEYKIELLAKEVETILFVHPNTKPIENDTRLITKEPSLNPYVSCKIGRTQISKMEKFENKVILNLLKYSRVTYSDNLTAKEFNDIIYMYI